MIGRTLSLLPLSLLLVTGCSSSGGGGNNPTPSDAGDTGDTASSGPSVEVACADTIDSIYGDPGALPKDRGAIIKCARDKDVSKADLQARVNADGYTARALQSGAKVYRVLFRTERGTQPATPGYSSATLYLPDTPRDGKMPVIVAAHGSRGQAAACAPSKSDPAGDNVKADYESLVYPLVGAGLAVIAPDWAGYSNFEAKDNPPSAYASADDVGKSTLDAARAMRKLVPSLVNDKLVLYGHSQGGHTALSALAVSATDGADVAVSAVVVYSPLWLSQRTWGALMFLATTYPIKTSAAPNAVSVWYHYTHGELLDGPGHGVDVFAADKRAAIKSFVEKDCWSDNYPDLEAIGTTALDLYDPAYIDAIKLPSAVGGVGDCSTTEPAKTLCTKWMTRFAADRPHFADALKKVPILVFYGLKDTTIVPDRATCAFERLKTDAMTTTYCVDPDGTHGSALRKKPDYAVDWLLSQTTGTAAPAPCAANESAIVDPATGKLVTCATPPPND
jgi:alpha-beta hydrolase superfamily lysophospholipase